MEAGAHTSTETVGRGVALCALAYGLAGVVALALGFAVSDEHPILVVAVADLGATLVIFAFSTGFRNSSFYDPYWSVAPVVIAVYWFLFGLAAEPSYWWTIVGPIAMVMMFVFASVPMIDRRGMERRPGYAAHMANVSAIAPWFPKR